MSSTNARTLLVGRVVGWALWLAVALAIGLPSPDGVVGWELALPASVLAGVLLFVALAGGRIPRPVVRRDRAAALTARGGYLTLRSAVEEVAWRGIAIGSLAPLVGTGPALAISTAGFALWHVPKLGRAAAAHLLTGLVFGCLYLVSGGLAAPILAHVSYNLMIALALESQRRRPAFSPRAQAPAPPIAALQGVTKCFGPTVALDEVDLRIEAGETVALLGPNGAGKTTALALLVGLRRPDRGVATLFGLAPTDRRALARIGVTPQQASFPETLRVVEIVRLVRRHFPRPLPTEEILERFGLTEIARRQTGGLSGGERRRLAVALAFAGNPSLVVLDEPTTGLDVESRREVWGVVREFAAGGGTVLLTTHHLEEADQLASRVVVLEEGRVLAAASPAALRDGARVKRIRLRTVPLPDLPEVLRIARDNGRTTLYTEDVESVVRRLVHESVPLGDFEVTAASLEEAFLLLTGADL